MLVFNFVVVIFNVHTWKNDVGKVSLLHAHPFKKFYLFMKSKSMGVTHFINKTIEEESIK